MSSYFPSTIKLWNSLPYSIRSCTSLISFHNSLNAYFVYGCNFGPSCTCIFGTTNIYKKKKKKKKNSVLARFDYFQAIVGTAWM